MESEGAFGSRQGASVRKIDDLRKGTVVPSSLTSLVSGRSDQEFRNSRISVFTD